MWASKGGLTHSEIMGLTWRQFFVYLDSFHWLTNEQSEDGQKRNKRADIKAMASNPRVKQRSDTEREKAKKFLAEWEKKRKGTGETRILYHGGHG